jgi:hypothetical protein
MGYWKREYTERRTGKPLFLAEAKADPAPPPAEKDAGQASADTPPKPSTQGQTPMAQEAPQ